MIPVNDTDVKLPSIDLLFINKEYNVSCSLSSVKNNSDRYRNRYWNNDQLFRAKVKNSYRYCNVISAFGINYCKSFALFWFHRILYSQLFLSAKYQNIYLF